MRIVQTINGYKDPQVFGVVVTFEHQGKEYVSYCDFHRRAPLGEILSITFQENMEGEPIEIPQDETSTVWSIGVQNVILEAARDFVIRYYNERTEEQLADMEKNPPPPPPTPYGTLLSKLKSIH
jgi:hypothetical protein